MRGRGLLAAFLLGVSLCFVPALGHGEDLVDLSPQEWVAWVEATRLFRKQMHDELKASSMDIHLLNARVGYMMRNPNGFLLIALVYDPYGVGGKAWSFPEGVDTKNKIYVAVTDNRGAFSDKSEVVLLDQFKKELDLIYVGLFTIAADMDTDIVAKFFSQENVPLGYFYQGEYYLWGEKEK